MSNKKMEACTWAALLSLFGCEQEYPNACEEWRTPLEANEEGDLVPFSVQAAVADISPLEHDIAWSPLAPKSIAGTQTVMRMEMTVVEGTIEQIKAKNNAVEGDVAWTCSNSIEAEVDVALSTADGQLDETFTGGLRVWPAGDEPGAAQLTSVHIEPSELDGLLVFDGPPPVMVFSYARSLDAKVSVSLLVTDRQEESAPKTGKRPQKSEATAWYLWELEP